MLSQQDNLLLECLQSNFPLSPRPYRNIAKKFGLREKQLIDKLRSFKKKGIIRYIGAIFELKRIGIKSGLFALSVPKQDVQRVARIINHYPEVTHNYLRKGKFNLWFTVCASSKKRLANIIEEIEQKTKINDILNLATLKVFKLSAKFRLDKICNL